MTGKNLKRADKLKQEMKDMYLNCATKIFQEKGFNDTRVKDITQMAGTSVGNFYNYFKTKEDIFEELMRSFAEFVIKHLKKLHEHEVPPIPMIRELFQKYIDEFRDKADLALIYLEQMSGINQKFREMKNEYDDLSTVEIKKIMDRLLSVDFIPKQDTELTSRIWLGAILETFRWWVLTDFREDEKEVIKQLADFLVLGTVSKRHE